MLLGLSDPDKKGENDPTATEPRLTYGVIEMPKATHRPMQGRITEARSMLDAHTRETVAWHFDPKTGCPFWLEYARSLSFDPRKEVQCYDDLDKFPFFEDERRR